MSKKQRYLECDILKALEGIKNGVSIRGAANEFHIPESTLRWRLKHGNDASNSGGKASFLSYSDERQLVKYAGFMANIGSPVNAKWLMQTAARIAVKRCVSLSFFQTKFKRDPTYYESPNGLHSYYN